MMPTQPGFDTAFEPVALYGIAYLFANGNPHGKFSFRWQKWCIKMAAAQAVGCTGKLQILVVWLDPADHSLYTEYFSPLGSAACQYLTSVFGGHSQAKAMGILTGSV